MNISDLIKGKKERRINTKVPFKDINRPLIMTIFGINVFGKDGRDDDIVEIIIGQTCKDDSNSLKSFENLFNRIKVEKGKEFKKAKDGYYYADGKVVLKPKA